MMPHYDGFPTPRTVRISTILMNRPRPFLTSRGCGQGTPVILALSAWIGFVGCTTSQSEQLTPPSSTQKALMGKTKQDLMSCTTVQPAESTVGDLAILRYYKEASVLEE